MTTPPNTQNYNIVPNRVPMTDSKTGLVSRPWYVFFSNLFGSAQASGEDYTIDGIMSGSVGESSNDVFDVQSVMQPAQTSMQDSVESAMSGSVVDTQKLAEQAFLNALMLSGGGTSSAAPSTPLVPVQSWQVPFAWAVVDPYTNTIINAHNLTCTFSGGNSFSNFSFINPPANAKYSVTLGNSYWSIGQPAVAFLSSASITTSGFLVITIDPTNGANNEVDYLSVMVFSDSAEVMVSPSVRVTQLAKTSNVALPQNALYTVPWDTASEDDAGLWSSGNPTQIVIPSGVNQVRITCSLDVDYAWASGGFDTFYCWIIRNGTNPSTSTHPVAVTTTPFGFKMNCSTGVVNVSPGDYFNVVVLSNYAGLNLYADNQTWLNVEVIS